MEGIWEFEGFQFGNILEHRGETISYYVEGLWEQTSMLFFKIKNGTILH